MYRKLESRRWKVGKTESQKEFYNEWMRLPDFLPPRLADLYSPAQVCDATTTAILTTAGNIKKVLAKNQDFLCYLPPLFILQTAA
ncbi:MAG: hypothetical protein EAZ16_11560 [Sphingobacteriales bacterium]|nr:MAG: hypothetical protein EAZ16_11560 [Sphingobacteriales bacterium]